MKSKALGIPVNFDKYVFFLELKIELKYLLVIIKFRNV
jgi:hypothetical protein